MNYPKSFDVGDLAKVESGGFLPLQRWMQDYKDEPIKVSFKDDDLDGMELESQGRLAYIFKDEDLSSSK